MKKTQKLLAKLLINLTIKILPKGDLKNNVLEFYINNFIFI